MGVRVRRRPASIEEDMLDTVVFKRAMSLPFVIDLVCISGYHATPVNAKGGTTPALDVEESVMR